jgi:SRSO17 transposase
VRQRIEHDYRELKHGLGCPTSMAAPGWHGRRHHVILVTTAQAFLTLRCYAPSARTAA